MGITLMKEKVIECCKTFVLKKTEIRISTFGMGITPRETMTRVMFKDVVSVKLDF